MTQHTESKTTHTRGPFYRYDGGEDSQMILIASSSEDKLIAEVRQDDVTDAEAEANARLIAASPDLLAALEHTAHVYDTQPGAGVPIALIRAAIAKAKGQ